MGDRPAPLRGLRRLGFLGDVTLFSAAQALAGAAFGAYVFISARLLGPAEFALFQAVMGVYGILNVFSSPLNIAAVHTVASADETAKSALLGSFVRIATWIGIALAVVVVTASPGLAGLMHSRSPAPFMSLAVLLLASTILTTLYGGLQGRNRYDTFALMKTAESVLVLSAGTSFMIMGYRAGGAVGGYAVAMSTIVVLLLSRRGLCAFGARAAFGGRKQVIALLRPMAVLGLILFVTNYPMLVVRRRLPGDLAGQYGALFSLRNLVFPFALAVAVPLYTRSVSRDRESHLLLKALGTIMCLATVLTGVAMFCPVRFFSLVFGEAYVQASGFMLLYVAALILTMLCMVVMFRGAAIGSFIFAPLAVAALVIVPIATVRRLTIGRIIGTQIVALLACLALAGILGAVRKMTRAGHRVHRRQGLD